MGMSPTTAPVWLAGIIFLIFSKKIKDFRFLAVLFISLFLFMLLSGVSRSDRLAFAYPAAFAGGALFYENIFLKYNVKWLKTVFVLFVISGLALALPIILPYFGYEVVEAHIQFLGYNTEIEKGKKPRLPQLLADRIGWEEKFKFVLSAYQSLPDTDKKEIIIAAGNYGQAGALELFGKDYNLPPVVCAHNNYYLWSKSRLKGSILLLLGHEEDYHGLTESFRQVKAYPGEYKNKFVSPHENNLKVFICREPNIPYAQMLERSKFYY